MSNTSLQYNIDALSRADKKIRELSIYIDELENLVKDASGALRVNGLGTIAWQIDDRLASMESIQS